MQEANGTSAVDAGTDKPETTPPAPRQITATMTPCGSLSLTRGVDEIIRGQQGMSGAVGAAEREMSPAEIGAMAERDARIRKVKQFRVQLDGVLRQMKTLEPTIFGSEARHEAVRKVQEGIMWLGMELKELGEKNPYPNSYNPTNTLVDQTADGLKL